MTRHVTASGPDLSSALVRGLADLLDCDERDVELDLAAPGAQDVAGDVRLNLHIEVEDTADDDADRDPDTEGDANARSDDRDERDDRDHERSAEDLDEEADAAADFMEGLLDALDLPGDLRIHVEDGYAEVEVVEIGSGALIGRRGQTLEAIQELVRCTLQRQFQRRARVKIDAEGYRARRLEKLLEKADQAIDDVLDTGDSQRLEPMDVFERKAVHQIVAEVDGVTSRSQGREPARRVIIELDE